MYKIICVTNRKLCAGDFLVRLEKTAAAHPDALILREKDLSEDEYCFLAEKTVKICEKYNTPIILHFFVSAAKKLGVKAVHLPLELLKSLKSEDRMYFNVLGASCHSLKDAQTAEKLGCTYIAAGHIFETDCKKGLKGKGLGFLSGLCAELSLPVYAIGGVDKNNIKSVMLSGASGVFIMSGFMLCENPADYLKQLKEAEHEI